MTFNPENKPNYLGGGGQAQKRGNADTTQTLPGGTALEPQDSVTSPSGPTRILPGSFGAGPIDEAGAASAGASDSPLTPPSNGSWSQPTWFIDPVHGADVNTGFTKSTPLRTWRALVAKFGTISPVLAQTTTITFLSDQPDDSDPVVFTPIIRTPGSVGLVGTPTMIASGKLGAVTAKSRAAGTSLQANLGAAAAGSQGLILDNSTQGGRCWVDSVAGAVATLTQPLAPNNTYPGVLPTNAPAEVDSFTLGDSFTLQRPTQVFVAILQPRTFSTTVPSAISVFMQDIWVPPPPGVTLPSTDLGAPGFAYFNAGLIMTECRIDRWVMVEAVGAVFTETIPGAVNCWLASSGEIFNWYLAGGAVNTLQALAPAPAPIITGGSIYDGDIMLHGELSVVPGQNITWPRTLFALAWMDFASGLGNLNAPADIQGGDYLAQGSIWGPAGGFFLNVGPGGALFYQTSAAASFLSPITLEMLNAGTADSMSGGAINSGITITVAHLDAAAGAAGFGGNAFNLKGQNIALAF